LIKPFFSIICPCYNQGHYLTEAVQSVLNQDFVDWELIIIDDGSTDSTSEVANLYAQSDSRIKLIRQENRGLSAARNVGLQLASGECIHLLDADDIVLNNTYNVVQKAVQNSQADLLVGGYSYFDKTGYFHTHFFVDEFIDTQSILRANIAPPVAFFFRKELIDIIGNFDTTLKSCEDWDFWIRAEKMGAKIHSISEVLVAYRYVPNSMSRNPRVMYEALTEVSRRAGQPDSRLPKEALNNRITKLDYPEIQKIHLITVLGVMLHQGKAEEARNWYQVEKEKWNWKLLSSDWKRLSSPLSWGYFFERTEIQKLLTETRPCFAIFFSGLGYSKIESDKLIKLILAPQLKKRNHQKWGKLLGGVKNKLNWY